LTRRPLLFGGFPSPKHVPISPISLRSVAIVSATFVGLVIVEIMRLLKEARHVWIAG
jgi:hypothetical protein